MAVFAASLLWLLCLALAAIGISEEVKTEIVDVHHTHRGNDYDTDDGPSPSMTPNPCLSSSPSEVDLSAGSHKGSHWVPCWTFGRNPTAMDLTFRRDSDDGTDDSPNPSPSPKWSPDDSDLENESLDVDPAVKASSAAFVFLLLIGGWRDKCDDFIPAPQRRGQRPEGVNSKGRAQKDTGAATTAPLGAQTKLGDAKQVRGAAAQQMEEAEAAHLRILDEYCATTKAKPAPQAGPPIEGWQAPEVGEAFSEGIEEYQPEDRTRTATTLWATAAWMILMFYISFANITTWVQLARKYLNESGNDADIFTTCEARVAEQDTPKEKATLAADRWRLLATAATPAKRSEHGASGGEFAAIRGNRALASARLLPKHGLGGANFDGAKTCAAFAQSIADQWATLADWNIPPRQDGQRQFMGKIGGGPPRPDVEVTCDKGKGSWIDYGVARPKAQPDPTSARALQGAARREKQSSGTHLQDMFDEVCAEEPAEQATGEYLYRATEGREAQEGAATTMCDTRASAVESATWTTRKLDKPQRRRCRGRAAGLGAKMTRSRPAPGRARMRYAAAEHWGICATARDRYLPLWMANKAELHHMRDMGQDDVFGHKITESEREQYYLQLGTVENSTVDKPKDLFDATERHCTVAQARGLTAHRPQARLWEGIWKDPVDTTDQLMARLAQLRKEAHEGDLPELTVDHIDAILNSASGAKAIGVDGAGPAVARRLPVQAREWRSAGITHWVRAKGRCFSYGGKQDIVGGKAAGRCLIATIGRGESMLDLAVAAPMQVAKEWIASRQQHPEVYDRVSSRHKNDASSTNEKKLRDLLKADLPPAVATAIQTELQQAKKPPPTDAWGAAQKAKQELRKTEQATQKAAIGVRRARADLETASEVHASKVEQQAMAELAYQKALSTLQTEQAREAPQRNKLIIDYDIFETADPADMDENERKTFMEYKKEFDTARPQLESAAQKLQNLMESIKRFDQERVAKRRRQEGGDEAPSVEAGRGGGAGAPPAMPATPGAATAPAPVPPQPPLDDEWFKSLSEDSLRQAAETSKTKAQLFFSNITEWGPQAERWAAPTGKRYQLLALVETHISQAKQQHEFLKIGKDDWRSSKCYAVPTGRSAEGTKGGEMVLARKSAAASTFDAMRHQSRQLYAVDPCHGFAPMTWHRKTGNLVVIAFYIEPHHSITGPVHERMVALTAFLDMLADPWVVLADWNMSPCQLADSGYPEEWGGSILVAPGSATCDKGSGSTIDYAAVKRGWEMSAVIRQVHDVPWGTHCGLVVCAGESQPWPQRQAGPNSKTSLRKKAALDKRRNQLPDTLQEVFDELTQSQEDAAAPPVLVAADVDYVGGVDFAIPLDLWRRHQDDVRSTLSTPDENGTLVTYDTQRPPEKLLDNVGTGADGVVTDTVMHATDPSRDKWSTLDVNDALNTYGTAGPPEKAGSQHPPGRTRLLEGAPLVFRGMLYDKVGACTDGAAVRMNATQPRPSELSWGLPPHFLHERDPEATTLVSTHYAKWLSTFEATHQKHENLVRSNLTLLQLRVTDFHGKRDLLLPKVEEDEVFRWSELVRTITILDDEERSELICRTEAWSGRAAAHAAYQSKKKYSGWLADMRKAKPGVLHRQVKPQEQQRLEIYISGTSVSNPNLIMDAKRQEWEKAWTPRETKQHILDALDKARRQTREEPPDAIQLEQLKRTLSIMPGSKAKGVDMIGPRDMLRLPDLERNLRRRGVPVSATTTATDLGIDMAAGTRRVQKKAGERARAATARTKRIVKMRNTAQQARIAKGLWATGALPQGVYGHQVRGLARHALLRWRRQAAAAATGQAAGRCLTTLLGSTFDGADPGVQLRAQSLRQWIRFWQDQPHLHQRIRRTWALLKTRLTIAGPKIWSYVTGPTGAAIATLLEAGWDPKAADCWQRVHDEYLEQWTFPDDGAELVYLDYESVLDDLAEDLQGRLWATAAAHEHGAPLACGADLTMGSLSVEAPRRFGEAVVVEGDGGASGFVSAVDALEESVIQMVRGEDSVGVFEAGAAACDGAPSASTPPRARSPAARPDLRGCAGERFHGRRATPEPCRVGIPAWPNGWTTECASQFRIRSTSCSTPAPCRSL
ncbi:unnamed protein product [Prorocentrum cordatum]|uniref:Uncharacterized protein n=1 Tax=Prorocentrum cordatum TaxID=2364126 RepID=A0ABN9XTR0_9DINO|nr:unnamed protein product [Polarella glacialis]